MPGKIKEIRFGVKKHDIEAVITMVDGTVLKRIWENVPVDLKVEISSMNFDLLHSLDSGIDYEIDEEKNEIVYKDKFYIVLGFLDAIDNLFFIR